MAGTAALPPELIHVFTTLKVLACPVDGELLELPFGVVQPVLAHRL